MHLSIHPSHWFHHEAMQGAQLSGGYRLRQLLHDGATWSIVVLSATLCAVCALAILSGGILSNEPYTTFHVPCVMETAAV